MYAIILTGGKQVKVEEGQAIYIEKVDAAKDVVRAVPVKVPGRER